MMELEVTLRVPVDGGWRERFAFADIFRIRAPHLGVSVDFFRVYVKHRFVDALKDGVRLSDRKAAAKAAGDWIALVYGRQLQKPEDEKMSTSDPLDVASMPREERNKLARELAQQHPELAARIMGPHAADSLQLKRPLTPRPSRDRDPEAEGYPPEPADARVPLEARRLSAEPTSARSTRSAPDAGTG